MQKLIELYNIIKSHPKYTIFVDLDGVLVDFDKGYKELTGYNTSHAKLQDKEEFWKLLNNSLEQKNITEKDYWSNLEWMKDGKQLWNYISRYNPYILTAPSRNPESQEGKKEWVENNIGYVKKVIFSSSYKKQLYSKPNNILIDDREDIIKKWNDRGGIGIYHRSTSSTIKELEKIGL